MITSDSTGKVQASHTTGRRGSLVIVGTGIEFGRHMTERARSEILAADIVYCLVDPFVLEWLYQVHPKVASLHGYYAEGKDRRETYRQMEADILGSVYSGNRVCAAFYGHPGVFADVPHSAMRKARAKGYTVRMEAGVSAEACLYADLGIDPGKLGVQCVEATQFLVYEHVADPTAFLILWQVALCGDLTCSSFETRPERLQVLVDKLCRFYPADTEVILYEAATLSIERARADRLDLCDLPDAHFHEHTTLVVPPTRQLRPDIAALEALGHEPTILRPLP